MAKVELKQPIVDEIKAKIDGAATVVLVDYRGLTVEQDTKLRKGLREAGCECANVVKVLRKVKLTAVDSRCGFPRKSDYSRLPRKMKYLI